MAPGQIGQRGRDVLLRVVVEARRGQPGHALGGGRAEEAVSVRTKEQDHAKLNHVQVKNITGVNGLCQAIAY